jgi:hypothetical protein
MGSGAGHVLLALLAAVCSHTSIASAVPPQQKPVLQSSQRERALREAVPGRPLAPQPAATRTTKSLAQVRFLSLVAAVSFCTFSIA